MLTIRHFALRGKCRIHFAEVVNEQQMVLDDAGSGDEAEIESAQGLVLADPPQALSTVNRRDVHPERAQRLFASPTHGKREATKSARRVPSRRPEGGLR